MVVVFEAPPPVPFTVMVNVPLVALPFDEILIVELPFPPEIADGLKLMLTPFPCPDADSEIELAYPWLTAVVTVELPDDEPLVTVSVVGLAEMLKTVVIAVTVTLTVVVAVVPSVPVPVTVTLYVPGVAVGVAVNARVVLSDDAI